MLKDEFLKMQEQDLVTSSNSGAKQILECFKEVLKDYPTSLDIDPSLNCEDCFNKLKSKARAEARDGMFYFGPSNTKKFILNYLKIEEIKNDKQIKRLEDFF